jgi:predicted metal-dependent phosphoesterase TrpH
LIRSAIVLKVELHSHSADDPVDRIAYTTNQLIARAAALGYTALAVTLHDRQLDIRPFLSFAAERGVTLIPGIERTIHGKHVLLLNFRRGAEDVRSFEDLARLKQRELGLVVAPHAFFPAPTCLRGLMDRHAGLFDAVEHNAMFTSSMNFNRRAETWAHEHRKPMVGNGDVHRLRQLGTTYSMVDAEPNADAICAAILAGKVDVVARPLSWGEAGGLMIDLVANSMLSPRWYKGHLARPPYRGRAG